MDKKLIEQMRDNLLAERSVLEEELSQLGRRNASNKNKWDPTPPDIDPAAYADKNELADRFEDFEEIRSAEAQLEIRLEHVNTALENIKRGTYGTCSVDGTPIEEARLRANPAATTCIKHASHE